MHGGGQQAGPPAGGGGGPAATQHNVNEVIKIMDNKNLNCIVK